MRNGAPFWSPRRKFYNNSNQQPPAAWTETGLVSPTDNSYAYGGNPYQVNANPYSSRSASLTVDTNISFSRSAAQGYGNYTSPPYGEELDKISPHRRHGNPRSSPASKQGQSKRNALPPDGFIYQVSSCYFSPFCLLSHVPFLSLGSI